MLGIFHIWDPLHPTELPDSYAQSRTQISSLHPHSWNFGGYSLPTKQSMDFSAYHRMLLTICVNLLTYLFSQKFPFLCFVPLTYSSQANLSSLFPEMLGICFLFTFALSVWSFSFTFICLRPSSLRKFDSDAIYFMKHSLIVSNKLISYFFESLQHFLCTSLVNIYLYFDLRLYLPFSSLRLYFISLVVF